MERVETRPGLLWLGILLIVLVAAALAMFVTGTRAPEPDKALLYDIDAYEKIDPALVRFEETGQIPVAIEGATGLALAPGGDLCVTGRSALVVIDRGGAEHSRMSLDGTPTCVAVTPAGAVLIGMEDRVLRADAAGATASPWARLQARAYVTSIAAGDDEVFVADAGNRVVVRLDREGRVLGHIGRADPGGDIPGLVIPSPYCDVAFDDEGALWIVNPGRHGLENYRPTGALVTSWYRPSVRVDGFCGCCNPVHIAFRPDGSLVTAEKGLARVKLYDAAFSFVGFVSGPDSFPDSSLGLRCGDARIPIQDLAVDADGRVLVLDADRSAVRIFTESARDG